jgi:hypothetical protein
MGAEPLGDIFGFELSLVGGSTKSPNIDRLSSENGEGLGSILHTGLVLGLSVPMGFTFEALLIPSVSSNDMKVSQTSIGVKWTTDKSVIVLPFDLAFRGFISNMSLGFTQDSTGVGTKVDYKNNQTGFQMLISPGLPAFEPYLGLGYVQSKNNLSATATAVFDPSLTSGTSADVTVSSMQTILGFNFYAAVFSLGFEYVNSFGTNHMTGKFGFYF